MMSRRHGKFRVPTHDDGAIAIMVALLSVVLFGFAALVVDIGNAYDVRSQSQTAVDAAARAGVTVLAAHGGVVTDDLAATVKDYVAKNGGPTNWNGCTDANSGGWDTADSIDPSDRCITQKSVGGTYQLRVQLPARHVAATLGGIFGVSSIKVAPLAVAQSGDTPSPPCGPCKPALDDSGNPVSAVDFPQAAQDWLPNPDSTPAGTVDATDCPTAPGTFDNLDISAPCTVTQPGVYIFNDHNLIVDKNASLTASGVTFVFYGDGTLHVEGALALTSTPAGSAPTGVVAEDPGVALVLAQYPDNPPATKAPRRTFELGKAFRVGGSVYALDGTTWRTDAGDCPEPSTASTRCQVLPGDLAVTDTNFIGGIPVVAPQQVLPPQPPHLVK